MSLTAATLMLMYPIGFLLTLTFFKFFGEKIGMADYDPPHPDYYDDYENNVEAYLTFSIGWFVVVPLLIIAGIYIVLKNLTKWYLNI